MDAQDKPESLSQHEIAAVRDGLARVLESPGFSRAPSLSGFLTYVVEKMLSGAPSTITAYGIATEALGRSEDFDPQVDPAVRVTAGRLRQALDRYYANEGADDPVRLLMPSGGYEPQFELRAEEEDGAEAITPSPDVDELGEDEPAVIADTPEPEVSEPASQGLPWRQIGIPLAAAFGGAAIFGLSLLFATWFVGGGADDARPGAEAASTAPPRVETASVATAGPAPLPVAPYLAASNTRARRDFFPRVALYATRVETPTEWYRADAAEAAARSIVSRFDEISLISEGIKSEADYDLVVEAFGISGEMRIYIRLEHRERGVVIWSKDFALQAGADGALPSLTDFFGKALAPVLSPYGVLLSDLTRMDNPPPRIRCIATAYQYFDQETLSGRLAAHECLEAMISNGVVHPTIFALKAAMHLEGYVSAHPVIFDGDDPLREAGLAARRALRAGPSSARAHQASFDVRKIERRHEQALTAAENARAANPYDVEVLADVASYIASRGLHAEATPMFEQAADSALQLPAWVTANHAFHLLLTGDRIGAYELSVSRPASGSVLLAAAVAMAAHEYGDAAARDDALRTLLSREPGFADNPTERFLRRGFANFVARVLGAKLTAVIEASRSDQSEKKI